MNVLFAIVGLVILESVALCTGHNGTVLRLVIIAIAGLGGFSLAKVLEFRTITKNKIRDSLSK